MKKKVNIVTTITQQNQLNDVQNLPFSVRLIELRADLLQITAAIKNSTHVPLIYVLRSKQEGGAFTGSLKERHQLLIKASQIFDFVELEGERDLTLELLTAIPVEKRRISWSGTAENYSSLLQRVKKYKQVPASIYKIVIDTTKHRDALSIMHLLKISNHKDVVAYAIGKTSAWTQVLAPFLGSPEVHSSIDSQDQTTLCFSPNQLIEDYGLPEVYPLEQLFGIVGNPVLGSISPNQHNIAYRALNLPYLYLPFQTEDFLSFMNEVMENSSFPIPISGVTVVAPFKRQGYLASKYKEDSDDQTYGVCNGMIKKEQEWLSFSTDAFGAIEALNRTMQNWSEKRIAIIGCGGTGRTIAAALKKYTSDITLVNRTFAKGVEIAAAMRLPFVTLQEFNASDFDIIIHATPLGKNPEETPFKLTDLKPDSIVIDHVYSIQRETALVKYCRLCNIKVVDGIEIARLQINQQFTSLTAIEKPIIKTTNQNLKIN
ncbi:type I 3-dehydroquinate dehydratase [Aquimarina sp. 2201CG14-23]|uniref:type I 3-dehydroquinate dehydratase n=1 Tax=Aquimarina mycalae TaxID=3040073 RepID=UPI002477EE6A|nr:bifunctional type I 3-dehydroquinate dehydratase/shikimate dehydrogenase [Aquimarina sp. 2201CG14-23]MDH7448114.1 type I 3-dehydroquinate dehydratase [Aquimarina sp. 2201CG14-23]